MGMIWPPVSDAAAGHHQDQRRDDRLHADERHQHAIPHAGEHAHGEGGGQCFNDPRRIVGEDAGGRRARDCYDRADGDINAACGDHERHAERDEHERCGTIKDIDRRAEPVAVEHCD